MAFPSSWSGKRCLEPQFAAITAAGNKELHWVRRFKRQIGINLALQGGGAHGAFTWGVLDRLLEDEGIRLGWVSGTSAGAVNAIALAAGYAQGGREGAREKLREVWHAVHKVGVTDLLRLNPFLFGLTRSGAMAQMTGLLSPYDFNPLGFDPLRRLLAECIDFEAVRRGPLELLIAATEVATGRARLFRRAEMSVDAVLASACLPTLHHATQIDGIAYWDGGFSANPDLVNLAMQSPVGDTLLVQLSPLVKNELPTGVREIAGHVNRMTFNAPLLRDVQMIETVRATARGMFGYRGPWVSLARHRFHLIEAGRYTASLSADSKMKPDWGLFTYLHGAGRTETHKWLDRHRADVGRRSSVDLKARFLNAPAPAAEPPPPQPRISAGDEAPPPPR
jgi:NTE family protein